jgi:hydrogenase maturation factor HypF (carbamoyltransferase family)
MDEDPIKVVCEHCGHQGYMDIRYFNEPVICPNCGLCNEFNLNQKETE